MSPSSNGNSNPSEISRILTFLLPIVSFLFWISFFKPSFPIRFFTFWGRFTMLEMMDPIFLKEIAMRLYLSRISERNRWKWWIWYRPIHYAASSTITLVKERILYEWPKGAISFVFYLCNFSTFALIFSVHMSLVWC